MELGPARPLASTRRGVVVRLGRDDVRGWEFPGGAPFWLGEPAEAAGAASPSWGPPPAATDDSIAYWISQGKLVRRAIGWRASSANAGAGPSVSVAAAAASVTPPSSSGAIAGDAVSGARVSATTVVLPGGARRDVVAYISTPPGAGSDMVARIWVDKAGIVDLSPEGAGATAVALRSTGSRVAAISLDGRSAMSPLHARWLDISAERGVQPEPDTVLFVGPPPESHTEVALAITDEGPVAVVPLPKDTAHFGLATVKMGWTPKVDTEPSWRVYPNGIDPAPVAAAELCGAGYVAYARPASAEPGAPAVVAIAPLVGSDLGTELIVAEGSRIACVALSEQAKGGGFVAWVADGRAFGRALGCS